MIFCSPTLELRKEIEYEGTSIEDVTVFVLDERLQTQSVTTNEDGQFDLSAFVESETPYRILCIHTI